MSDFNSQKSANSAALRRDTEDAKLLERAAHQWVKEGFLESEEEGERRKKEFEAEREQIQVERVQGELPARFPCENWNWPEALQRAPQLSKEQIEREQQEFERAVHDEAEKLCVEHRLKPKKPVPCKNLPKNSLQHLADQLGKSTRQVRRMCEIGLIPGAYQTKGGHWRIPYSHKLLDQVKAALKGKTRRRDVVFYDKLCRTAQNRELPSEDELIGGCRAFALGPDKYNLMFAIKTLHDAGTKITVGEIARSMGINRSTLYRKFGGERLKSAIRSVQYIYQPEPALHFHDLGKHPDDV